jgi:acetyltransferase-like isoleucine patch superfamily enzyme
MIYKKSWKYILCKSNSCVRVYRLFYQPKAVKNFKDVKKGDLGGYVGGYHNLSQSGDCWAYGNAIIGDCAKVSENAHVHQNARVYGDAQVYENAKISGYAQITGKVKIHGDAKVSGDVLVLDSVEILGNARICGASKITGNKIISE